MRASFRSYPPFSNSVRSRDKIRANEFTCVIYTRVAAPLQGEVKVKGRNRRHYLPVFSFTVAPLSPLKMADYRLASLEGLNHVCGKKIDWPTATIHITENPISEAVVC